jgi:lipopolysaccharide heptosyltransferase II
VNEAVLLPLRGPIRRILVLRPRALGDVLLATPALRALRHGFPDAELHVAVDDVLEPLLRDNPCVNRLWLLPRRRARGWRAWWPVYRDLRRARFDLVLDLHGSPRTALLAYWSGAANRVGYALRGRGRFYNLRVPRDADRRGRRAALYAAQTNLEIVARCGVRGDVLADTRLVLAQASPQVEAEAAAMLEAGAPRRPRVGLAPAGTWPAKTYPVEHWAQVGDLLAAAGRGVVLLWGPGEEHVVAAVRSRMRQPAAVLPATGIEAMAAVVGRLDLLICNDSGIKHVAVARGTPSLTLYGPTNPRAWSPPSGPHAGLRVALPCIACNRTQCTHRSCMQLLDPRAVAARALELATAVGPEGKRA